MKIIKIEEVKLYRVYVSKEDISEANFLIARKSNSRDQIYGEIVLGREY